MKDNRISLQKKSANLKIVIVKTLFIFIRPQFGNSLCAGDQK